MTNAARTTHPAYTLLLFLSLILTLLTVVLSAYIRLSVTNVGCDDWPQCYGVILSTADQRGVAVLTDAGDQMSHVVIRTAHRLIASALGVMVLAIAYIALRNRKTIRTGIVLPLILLGITLFLSLLGYLTPSPLVPLVTTANILGGMIMLAILWWLGQRSVMEIPPISVELKRGSRKLALVAMILVCLQIAMGGWTSANFAAAACPDIVGCGSNWSFEDAIEGLRLTRSLDTDAHMRVVQSSVMSAIQTIHRVMAIVTTLFLLWLTTWLIKAQSPLRNNAIVILLFLMLQILTAMLTIWMHAPLLIVTCHNAVAALLLLSVTNLTHRLTPTRILS